MLTLYWNIGILEYWQKYITKTRREGLGYEGY